MITLDLASVNVFARAWFRSCLHRAAWREDISAETRTTLLDLRERAYPDTMKLSGDEAELALWFCEGRVGDDPSLAEARQEIIDRLKEGLS